MAPIHADKVNGAITAIPGHMTKNSCQKRRKFGFAHLTRSHREFGVSDRAESADMAVDPMRLP